MKQASRSRLPRTEMNDSGWYNGYPWSERVAKLKELNRRIAAGEQAAARGPCQLCGDPNAAVEYHDEDYSKPYLWHPPALLALCRHCHRSKLHTRFMNPLLWQAFLAHVRRGGYASDLKDRGIRNEVNSYKRALAKGFVGSLVPLREYRGAVGKEWFAALPMDPATMASSLARPRP